MLTAKSDYAAFLQVTQNDLCLEEVCLELIRQGVKKLAFFQPAQYWSGETVPESFAADIKQIIYRLQDKGATCYFERVDVTPFLCDQRIKTETKFRMYCVNKIRNGGLARRVLIVDGDELWVPGTFDTIIRYVQRGARAICVDMIPVVGLPPYPVEGSKDRATVYIGPDVVLRSCRTPDCTITHIPKRLIYHFTGTRPTMDETILKHRRSGHYDDPRYDYEGWLKNRLPNLKPGDKNIHFFRSCQIWPTLRDWLPGELEKMPANIQKLCQKNTVVS